MAIFNIQEILHPSDSNQIKWEKVNYNFDQILANGGGPTGKKGNPGDQGSVGQTGQKGEKGDIGPQGLTGETTSRWKVIPINNGAAENEYVILKPKVSTDNYHPVIFLGDQDFNEVQDNNGRTNLRSTIVVGKHAVGGLSPSDELITFWHGQRTGTSNNIAITLSTSEQTDGDVDWTRFTLAETYGTNLNTDPAEIIEYFVELDKFTFKSNVSFESNVSTFKVPETNLDLNLVEAGMIRFRDGAFWGAFADVNGNVSWKEFCTAPCGAGAVAGTVAIFEQPADLNLNQYGGIVGNTVVINDENGNPSGDLEVDENGDPWTGEPATTIATNATTNATNATTNVPETIAFSGDVSQFNDVPHSGGTGEITYSTTPTIGLILSADKVTAPAWITINSYLDSGYNPELNFTVAVNATGARTGNIVIQHPNNASVTDTLTVSQLANPEYGAGCTDPGADNYDPNATSDDGSCTYCANFAKSGMSETNPTYPGASDGTFTMTATGGSGNYNLEVFGQDDDQLYNPFGLAAGNYYGRITDITYGCTVEHDFTLVDPALPTYNTLVATPGTASVDEGTVINYTVSTSNITDGTTVWLELSGTHNEADISGESSGGGAGQGKGIEITINGQQGTGSITVLEDVLLEAGDDETIIATLWATDSNGTQTGGLSVTRNINDTSFPLSASFTGNFNQTGACNVTGGIWTITYDGSQANFIDEMISVNTNIFINYARCVSASPTGWGADKIGWVFDLNGTNEQEGVDCTPYITEATTTIAPTTIAPTTNADPCAGGSNAVNHTVYNPNNSSLYVQYTLCGVNQGQSLGPFATATICADLLSVNPNGGNITFVDSVGCMGSGSGGGSGGDGSGSGDGFR
jgi:hypothetical protein